MRESSDPVNIHAGGKDERGPRSHRERPSVTGQGPTRENTVPPHRPVTRGDIGLRGPFVMRNSVRVPQTPTGVVSEKAERRAETVVPARL